MKTNAGKTRITHKNLQRRLQDDSRAYVESVGKHDKANIVQIASHPTGKGTVVRLVYGATKEMPVRGMGYVAAAYGIARHIPHEQLQVMFVNALGLAVNGVSRTASHRQAKMVETVGRMHLARLGPGVNRSVSFCEDNYLLRELTEQIRTPIQEIIEDDTHLSKHLAAKSGTERGDFATYSAAHVILHETPLATPDYGLSDESVQPVIPERIVSVGCQKEHPFYALRVKARKLLTDLDFVPSAQVFTRHVLPPYYIARGGEQSLDHAIDLGAIDMSQATDLSVQRDLAYLVGVTPGYNFMRDGFHG
jgi:hypothetical protein